MTRMEIHPTRPHGIEYREPVHQFQAMISGVEGDVLFCLARATNSYSAADIARKMNRSKTQVQNVLNRLEWLGIIDRFYADRWSWSRLNEDHPFTEHIRAMAHEKFESVRSD